MFGFLQSPRAPCCGKVPLIWRSHFCGLATRLHRDYGRWARLLVNRDATFLALAASVKHPGVGRMGKCCNPWGRERLLHDAMPVVGLAADVTICALSVKLRDDAADEAYLRKLASRGAATMLGRSTKTAERRLRSLGFPVDRVADTILSQANVEAEVSDPFEVSAPTATAYGEIFGFAATLQGGTDLQSVFEQMGRSLGRLVYWDDAWRDWSADQKRNRFNPLNTTPPAVLRDHMFREFDRFSSLVTGLPESPAQVCMMHVESETRNELPDLLDDEESGAGSSKRKAEKRDDDKCWHYCDPCSCCDPDCCSRKPSLDACFDCGPGDTGCIDCCPCDGCDCSC